MTQKRVLVLGASGSIGKSTIDVIKNFPSMFTLAGFSFHTNYNFAETIKKDFPNAVCSCTCTLENKATCGIEELIFQSKPDIAINAIAGAEGLKASVAVLNAGVDLALANKESIVMGYDLIKELAEKHNAEIIPVDSEHSAIFALMNAHGKVSVERIILTASGGPFRETPSSALSSKTLEDALKHPTWNMGCKITVDSASLANKALEVIEAVNLFDFPPERIIVAVHPQSIIHSMIQLKSGVVYSQMSPPDMRSPILYALAYPNMQPAYLNPLDFSKPFSLEFEPPRYNDFPLLKLGFKAAEKKSGYPIAFNAANEEAADAFFHKKIKFTDLAVITEKVLNFDWNRTLSSIEEVYNLDSEVRVKARSIIEKLN